MREDGPVSTALDHFSAPTRAWFEAAFAEPTPAQAGAWDAIAKCENALGKIGAFIAEAERRTGWSNFSRYKQRQHDTDRAVRDADALFDAALAEQDALKQKLKPLDRPPFDTDAPTNEEN